MYLNFYQFKKEPFQITPDPEFLFLSSSHKEAMAAIIYGIEGKKGFVAIVGGVGVGKTTILRSYLEKADRERLKIIYIFNANVSFASLLKTIYQDLGLVPRTDDIFLMVNQLHEALIEEYKKGYNVVLIVDEAQNMPMETLENLRMLSNLETATEKLVQIVLIGQPEFDDMLNRHELRQLRQRIAIKTMISPLTKEESARYIEHRLSKVMIKEDPVFTRGAMKEIVARSEGIPRVINILCDNALITGYGYQKKPVTAKIVREIAVDYESKRKERKEKEQEYYFRWKAAAGIVLVITAGGLFWASPYAPQLPQPFQDKAMTSRDAAIPARIAVKPPPVHTAVPEPAVREPVVPKPEPVIPKPEPVISRPKPVAPRPEPARVGAGALVKNQTAVSTLKKQSFISRVVEKGDTLSRLILQKYGFYDRSLLEKVKNSNPGIKDVNKIYIGETIVFPNMEGK